MIFSSSALFCAQEQKGRDGENKVGVLLFFVFEAMMFPMALVRAIRTVHVLLYRTCRSGKYLNRRLRAAQGNFAQWFGVVFHQVGVGGRANEQLRG